MADETTDFTGRKALVMGANNSAAAAIALALAKAGADVAVTSTNGDPEEAFSLRPLRRAIEAEGRQAIADIADLSNGSSVQIAVRQIVKQLGRIDLAVIVSAETLDKPSEGVTDAEWSRAIGFNFGAYFYAARALAKEFASNEAVDGVRGRVLALLPAELPSEASPVLVAARAGVQALAGALAREWHEDGIAVGVLAATANQDESAIVADALRFLGGDAA